MHWPNWSVRIHHNTFVVTIHPMHTQPRVITCTAPSIRYAATSQFRLDWFRLGHSDTLDISVTFQCALTHLSANPTLLHPPYKSIHSDHQSTIRDRQQLRTHQMARLATEYRGCSPRHSQIASALQPRSRGRHLQPRHSHQVHIQMSSREPRHLQSH